MPASQASTTLELPGRPGRYVFYETQSGLCDTYLGKEMLTAAQARMGEREEGKEAMQEGGREAGHSTSSESGPDCCRRRASKLCQERQL